jgi:hypothetical protein
MIKLGDNGPDASQIDIPGAVRLGRSSHTDLVVMGSLLQADVEEKENNFNGPSIGGINVSGSSKSQDATVMLQADIIDVGRGQKLVSLRATGKDHEGKISPNVSTDYSLMDMGDADFQKTAFGKATQRAMADLVSQILSTAQKFAPIDKPGAATPATTDSGNAQAPDDAQAATTTPTAPPACQFFFRIVLSATMDSLSGYTVKVNGTDRSSAITNGALEIDNPPDQLKFEVSVKNPPAGVKTQPSYSTDLPGKCDKPQKELQLAIDPKGNGSFNWME